MESQYELINQAMLRSVPRRTRQWLENVSNLTMVKRAIVTLVELANEDRSDNPIYVKSGEREVQERVSDYKVPASYEWCQIVNFTSRISLWESLLSRSKFCLEIKRIKYPVGLITATENESSLIMTPSEFEMFWTDMIANDSYFVCNTKEISKVSYVLEDVAGFYNLASTYDDGNMLTVNPSGDKVNLFVSEFFLLTSKANMTDMSRAQYAPLVSEFKSWFGRPVIKDVPETK